MAVVAAIAVAVVVCGTSARIDISEAHMAVVAVIKVEVICGTSGSIEVLVMVAVDTNDTHDSTGISEAPLAVMDAVPVVAAVTYSIKCSSSSSKIYTSVSIVVSKALVALIVAVVICSIKGGIDISEAPMAMLAAIAVGVVAYGTNGSIRNTKR
ncbi:hypothetical protein ElyMa_005829200 [Elysia marginata]|uniref:Uncharacterized protein n=1 Tax=Elysia marginata TaxID=1093978 RepID=A0AAV4FW43_9GAST|nr:hypothetical protein ElyMa_005829200 [Elysia marginata]